MKNFTFVILHYITLKDTIECVSSIQNNIQYKDWSIIIVDNASPNNSGEELEQKYKDEYNIKIIRSAVNLGFAKGNNLGYEYAKRVLKSDYICLVNNDTIITQKDFINKCMDIYSNEKYYVLGPNIISTIDGGQQNPFKKEIMTYKRLYKTLAIVIIHLLFNYLGIESMLKRTKNLLFSNKKNQRKKQELEYKEKQKNVMLHGSCLIFSPLFVNKFKGLCDKTFMYGEEEILFYICSKFGLLYMYDSSVQIFHKEASSTIQAVNNNTYKHLRFYYKNKIKSTLILKNMMKNKIDIKEFLCDL